jgi:hypothetical protein
MQSFFLFLFWIVLAVCFGLMSYGSHKGRKAMPKHLDKAQEGKWVAGYDFRMLKPIFDHLFWLEFLAFLLTCGAAIVEGLTYYYGL